MNYEDLHELDELLARHLEFTERFDEFLDELEEADDDTDSEALPDGEANEFLAVARDYLAAIAAQRDQLTAFWDRVLPPLEASEDVADRLRALQQRARLAGLDAEQRVWKQTLERLLAKHEGGGS